MINDFMQQIFAANPYLSRLYPVFHCTFVIGIIILQIFLAKKENKKMGLILPIIAFCYSVIMIIYGISNSIIPADMFLRDGPDIVRFFLFRFLNRNILTVILLAIYVFFRKKHKKQSDLDKMNIQDLE